MICHKRQSIYFFVLAGVFLWWLLLWAPQLLVSLSFLDDLCLKYVYKFFSPVCHQFDSRSLHIETIKFSVCARCTGIYNGFLIGLLLLPFLKKYEINRTKLWLILSVIPIIIDVGFSVFTLYESTNLLRIGTGLFFGVVSSFLLYKYLEDAILNFLLSLQTSQGKIYGSKT